MEPQKRGRAIAMTAAELGAYLTAARTCRVATVGADGAPHVVPLWFVWDGAHVWLNSVVKSQRWTDLVRDPRVALVVDGGHDFIELHGVEILGRVVVVGDVPRSATPDPALEEPERLFAQKYTVHETYTPDGRHAWLRVDVSKTVTWDFRKLAGLRA